VTAPREPSDTTLPPDPGLFTLQVTPTAAELSVATVSSTGTVVAVAPGSTVISETPMLLGFTRRVSVEAIRGAYQDLSGSYHLAAAFHGTDLDWFPGSGTPWTTTLASQYTPDTRSFTRTFSDLGAIAVGGVRYRAAPGPYPGRSITRGQWETEPSAAGQLLPHGSIRSSQPGLESCWRCLTECKSAAASAKP